MEIQRKPRKSDSGHLQRLPSAEVGLHGIEGWLRCEDIQAALSWYNRAKTSHSGTKKALAKIAKCMISIDLLVDFLGGNPRSFWRHHHRQSHLDEFLIAVDRFQGSVPDLCQRSEPLTHWRLAASSSLRSLSFWSRTIDRL